MTNTERDNNHPLLIIHWVDSFGCVPDWQDLDGLIPHITHPRSVGWLIAENADAILLGPNISDDQVVGQISIPKCSIKTAYHLTSEGAKAYKFEVDSKKASDG